MGVIENANCTENLRYCLPVKEKNMTTPYSNPSGNKVLTIPEVAAYLKISKSKIYYLVSQKQIPHLKLGRNVRIRESDLQEWLELQTEKVPINF
jgi:excisionase family DNA binding protein